MRSIKAFARNGMYICRSMKITYRCHFLLEICVRSVLLICFWILEDCEPYHSSIQPEQLWKYKYPHHENTVSTVLVLSLACIVPALFIVAWYVEQKDITDLVQGFLGLSLSIALNGTITSIIKLSVGRPRPDFFYRCFPDGNVPADYQCTGSSESISQGMKSFPSGHASFIFTGFGFLAFYLAGKLQTFSLEGKGQSFRLIAVLLPLLAALAVALSRVRDHWHHWEDVTVGGLIGLLTSYICYLHYYPSLWSENCHSPHPIIPHARSSLFLTDCDTVSSHHSSRPQLTEVKTL